MSSNDEGPSKMNKDSKYEKKSAMISSPREDKKKTKEVQIGSKKKNRYKIQEVIGTGAMGIVHKAINSETKETVAVKKIQKTGMRPDQQKAFINSVNTELQLMQELSHPNIINIIGSMEDKNHIYMVLEYVENGSLSALIEKFGAFPEKLAAAQMKQILKGLFYLHSNGIIHRDIKAANILLDNKGIAKLADFGVSAKMKSESEKRYTFVGTPYWMAPEVISMEGHTEKSDIWSIGCLVIELLTGHPPYWELEQMRAIFCVVQDEMPPLPDFVSPECKSFLSRCFIKSLEDRASAQELLNHPWIKKVKSYKSSYKKLTKTLRGKNKSKSKLKKGKEEEEPPQNTNTLEPNIEPISDHHMEDSTHKPLLNKKKAKKKQVTCFCC